MKLSEAIRSGSIPTTPDDVRVLPEWMPLLQTYVNCPGCWSCGPVAVVLAYLVGPIHGCSKEFVAGWVADGESKLTDGAAR